MPTDLKNIEQKIADAVRDKADAISLYCGYQQIELPKTLLEIPHLRSLSLEGLRTNLPSWLADIMGLESLVLVEAGNVGELLPHLWKLQRLRKLTLAFVDDLVELPSSLSKLNYLEELNVDGADFEIFPTIIGSLVSLQAFSYEYCDCELPEVFKALSTLPRLRRLRLTHYADEGGDFLPKEFCHLQAIEELDFSKWIELQELPECIGDMHKLRVLNLSNDDHQLEYTADIRELPESLGNLHNLEELDVYGLQDLKQFPISFSRLTRLKRLDIMCSGIDELRLTPQQWAHLEKLRMHGPLPDLRRCVNLKEFSWYQNGVSIDRNGKPHGTDGVISLPHISSLSKLESLWISGGALESVEFLSALTELRHLHLSCDFEKLPANFDKLEKLETVDIWGAKSLAALPGNLGNMPSLKRLYFSGCGIEDLPVSVRNRKDLHVDVRHCPVKWPQ